jgi:septum formation protein
MTLHHPPLYLASKSPRRQELLRAAGIEFELIDINVEEIYPPDMTIEDIPNIWPGKKRKLPFLC